MKNRIISFLLAAVFFCNLLPVCAEAASQQVITSTSDVSGSMFTTSSVLAKKLDSIFAGNTNVCYNATGTKPVNTVLGSRSVPNNDVWLYVDGTYIGTSCWIYAIGVYFTLFGEGTRGSAGPNSEEVTAAEGCRVSYDNFVEWGVHSGVGALIRIGTHSIVVLGYDEEQIAYVDGNGDGNGLVAVRIEPWSNLCSNLRSSIQFLIQPKASHFEALYGAPNPDEFLLIQKTYPAHSEFTANAATQIMSMPCSSEISASSVELSTVVAGEALTSYRLVLNKNGDYWYQVATKDGQPGYVPAHHLSWVKDLADQDDVTITGQTDPPSMTVGSRYTIRGTITSKYSKLTEVSVGIYSGSDTSGTPVTGASDSVSNNRYSLADSRVDMNTSFGKLSVGKHTYVVRSAYRNYYLTEENTVDYHTGTVTVQTSTFAVMPVGHSHDYSATVTPPTCTGEGYTTYTCTCGDSYVTDYVDVKEHDYLAEVTYPSGINKGYTDYVCSQGDDSYRVPWLDKSAYEGKTIACVGDSITVGVGVTPGETDYVTLLADRLGMDYIRLGVSGTTLCTDGSRNCNIGQLTEERLNGADVVTILMGINDFCAAGTGYYELGDINSTDTSTIYGAMKMWCERIVELRKTDSLRDTQFYFVTPVICSWNSSVTSARDWDQSKKNIHGYTLRDLCNAILEVAALYDVATIDLNLLSSMYYVDEKDHNTAEFGGDGVHPGAKGHEMMAEALAKALLQSNLRDDHTHTFGSWITTTWPSCLAGEQQRVCAVCSATESCTPEANKNHNYLEGFCSICGKTEMFYLIGDVNLDGSVDSMDTNILFRFANEDETLGALSAAQLIAGDVNKDGSVDSMDTNILFRFANEDDTLTWVPTAA